MKDFILRLAPQFRILAVLVAGVVLSWTGTEFVPALENESNLLGGVVAAGISYFLTWATPLVASYGYGAARARQLGARSPSDLNS